MNSKILDTNEYSIMISLKNKLLANALNSLIASEKNFIVIGMTHNLEGLQNLFHDVKPDLCICDWRIFGLSAEEIIANFQAYSKISKFIIYSENLKKSQIFQAMKFGAYGYCDTSEDPETLLNMMHLVSLGRVIMYDNNWQNENLNPLTVLTNRETELLQSICEGWSNLQIANRYGISRNTVKYHIKQIYDKLNVKNRMMAANLYRKYNHSS